MFPPWTTVSFLDSREKAVVFWLVVVAVWVTAKDASVWRAVGQVILTFVSSYKLPLLFGAAAAYAAAVVLAARQLGAWGDSATKPTVYAFLGTCVLVGKAVSSYDDPGGLRRLIRQVFTATILVDFLVNLYVFPLYVELALVPVVTLLVLTGVVAERNPAQAQVKSVTDWLVGAIGLATLAYVVIRLAMDLDAFLSWESAEDFLTVPAMAVAFVPFLWGVSRLSRWEMARLRRRFGVPDLEILG